MITNAVPEVDAKNFQGQLDDNEFEEIFGDSCTMGSTSKSSSEWRSSTINCRDSGTDDPFSSSSRRSCPNWESYTVFQKYDEEMMFLDRISAQKLHETGMSMHLISVYFIPTTNFELANSSRIIVFDLICFV